MEMTIPVIKISRNSFTPSLSVNMIDLLFNAVESEINVFKRDSASASISRAFIKIRPIVGKFSPKAFPAYIKIKMKHEEFTENSYIIFKYPTMS